MLSPAERRHESLLYQPFENGGPFVASEVHVQPVAQFIEEALTWEMVFRALDPADPDVYVEYEDWRDTGGEA